jgi:hypothetical protein
LQFASVGTSATTTVARLVSAIPGAAIQIGTWPVAWSVAEASGIAIAFAVLMWSARGTRRPAT